MLPPEQESCSSAGRLPFHHPSGDASRGIARLYGNGFKPSHWDAKGRIISWDEDGFAVQVESPWNMSGVPGIDGYRGLLDSWGLPCDGERSNSWVESANAMSCDLNGAQHKSESSSGAGSSRNSASWKLIRERS